MVCRKRSAARLCGLILVMGAALLSVGAAAAPARPPAAEILPNETVFLVHVPDVHELATRFMNSSMGQMSQDPELRPLVSGIYGSLADQMARIQEQVGLSLDDLVAIPQGEIMLAAVTPSAGPLAVVFLLHAGDQAESIETLLERADRVAQRNGARKVETTVAGTPVVTYENLGPERRAVSYVLREGTFLLSSDLSVLRQMLLAWDGGPALVLADNPSFQAIESRCRATALDAPQALLYADPIGILQTIGRDALPVRLVVAMLPQLGLDGVTAVGGAMRFDAGQFDAVSQFHVLLEPPRSGVIEVVSLEPSDFIPEPWVPAEVSSYSSLKLNPEQSLRAVRRIFDGIRGEGALSVWLQRRVLEPIGLDLEHEFLPALGGRLTYVALIERPIHERSGGWLIGLELDEVDAIRTSLEAVRERHSQVVVSRSFGGYEYFVAGPPTSGQEPEAPVTPDTPPQPQICFGIIGEHLVMADRVSFFQRAVGTVMGIEPPLAEEPDFKLVLSNLQRRSGGTPPAMISFERPDEGMRFFYELAASDRIRGQMHGAGGVGRLLAAALDEHGLPPFSVLQGYLAPGGAMLVDDETGWHYTSFGLRRSGP